MTATSPDRPRSLSTVTFRSASFLSSALLACLLPPPCAPAHVAASPLVDAADFDSLLNGDIQRTPVAGPQSAPAGGKVEHPAQTTAPVTTAPTAPAVRSVPLEVPATENNAAGVHAEPGGTDLKVSPGVDRVRATVPAAAAPEKSTRRTADEAAPQPATGRIIRDGNAPSENPEMEFEVKPTL